MCFFFEHVLICNFANILTQIDLQQLMSLFNFRIDEKQRRDYILSMQNYTSMGGYFLLICSIVLRLTKLCILLQSSHAKSNYLAENIWLYLFALHLFMGKLQFNGNKVQTEH